ncbi:transketolase [Anaeromyxobacter sp. Fw109-5]|uniref:transketolase n=1 Tax=Anaeromyxobacter sp. (strain Fw109-5) TaxID=404589 RepID=UPI002100EF56|nr:transketolase [Anaeromyxobacter sp. Fw109-5]
MRMTPATDRWAPLATQLRADSIRATTRAGSGHPTSSLSAADLMAVLLAGHLHYDWRHPRSPDNDRLVFSKGHAAPLLYAMLKAAGAISDEELLTLRKLGSRLEGHPSPRLPFVEVATGSLGQGLPIAIGVALAARLTRRDLRCWVLLGDSEMSEGSVYEALELGGHYRLASLVAIVDMNRLGQRGPTMLGWEGERYADRARAFGWKALVIDGHDHPAIDWACSEAERADRPVCIVARTKKGAGVALLEDREGWHGKALSEGEARLALAELGNPRCDLVIETPLPRRSSPQWSPRRGAYQAPRYEPGSRVATREAFGDALRALGDARDHVVALDGEVSNSTYSERFERAHPDRFFELYIAEQALVSAAVGMQVLGAVPFASTFAAFVTRAYDQLRMAAISRARLCLVGTHAGVSIGEDGPSQMGLEDLAMMRAVVGSTVLYPSCATTTADLVGQAADREGIVYLRATREKTPVLYGPGERFPIGGSRVVRGSSADAAAVIAAGITLHEALRAHDLLRAEGIAVRVVDLYSVKPIDAATVEACANECSGRLVVVEDHRPEGGLADAVSEVFAERRGPAIFRLAVRGMPGSGTPRELLDAAGIGAAAIVDAVKRATR